jgi:hypothetical protein
MLHHRGILAQATPDAGASDAIDVKQPPHSLALHLDSLEYDLSPLLMLVVALQVGRRRGGGWGSDDDVPCFRLSWPL